ALRPRLGDHFGIMRVKEYAELRRVEVFFIGDARRRLDFVGVVQQHAQISDAANTGFRAHGRLARFNARIAEDAFLGFAGLPIVIDLFVGTSGDTHAPSTALFLIDEDDAVLFPLVDGARGTRGDAGRVETVLA